MTTTARPRTIAPPEAARVSPPPKAPTAIAAASRRETKPAGIGFPGLCPASRGASTRSLTAPIPSWRAVIATPSRIASGSAPPARRATAPVTRPSRMDGNGWVRRIAATNRAQGFGRASDVDELAEVRDQVLDEPCAAVGHLRPDAGNEGMERDRRHDEVTAPVTADDRRRSATGCEHAFETGLVEAGRSAEVVDDLDDAAADHDVADELGHPRVDLIGGLLREPLAVFLRVGRQPGRRHVAPPGIGGS